MKSKKYFSGDLFGVFTFLKEVNRTEKTKRRGLFKCHCGKKFETNFDNAKRIKSCGCSRKGISYYHPRLINIYYGMIKRCKARSGKHYKNYASKGIKVCSEWLDDKILFVEWALKNGYADNLTIERLDNNKGYSPKNCTWIKLEEQPKNRGSNKLTEKDRLIIIDSTDNVKDIAEEFGISQGYVYDLKNRRKPFVR